MKRPLTLTFRALVIFVLIVSGTLVSKAQNYDLAASSGTFTYLTSGTIIPFADGDDALSDAIAMPFTFTFFGTGYNSLKVSTNGFITFDVSSLSSRNFNDIANVSVPVVAPLWDDLGERAAGAASYEVSGIVGSRVFTIEWRAWSWYYNAENESISFQIKLYEGSGKIEFIYRQEPGNIEEPSASIGIASGDPNYYFYSLSDASADPELDPDGNDNITEGPAMNQVYTFTVGAPPVTPTLQAADLSASSGADGESLTINWTNGDGAFRAVFVKETTSTSDLFAVADGEKYTADPNFGWAYVGDSWYCVYNGGGSEVTVTGLISGFDYRIQVIEYNGTNGQQKYLTTTSAENVINITTDLVVPSDPTSTMKLRHVGSNTVTIQTLDGKGYGALLFMKAGTSGTPPVVDNTSYFYDDAFGAGDEVGTSGWFCVGDLAYSGTRTITNLSTDQDYRIAIVDYNSADGDYKYHVVSVTDNPLQIHTAVHEENSSDYTFSASSGTFTALASGTAIDIIEADDQLSGQIPIGFTFKYGGVDFTQLRASSNGILTFNPLVTNEFSTAFNYLSSSDLAPLLAPLWDDLDGNGGQASYQTSGIPGSRIFTIEFKNWQWNYNASAGISFQVKLYETTNKIEFRYRQEAGGLVNPSASIGLRFNDMDDYLSLNNSSASPTVSTTSASSDIATKPATGQIYTFTPPKQNQIITFNTLENKKYGSGNFDLGATASSELTVSYESSNTAVATVSGKSVTIVGVGTTSITATQAGDTHYNAAPPVERSLTITEGDQVITFSDIPEKSVASAAFDLEATSNTNTAITYESANTAVATISGKKVTIVGVGTSEITASQAATDLYNAAQVTKTLTVVAKIQQTITFGEFAVKHYGDEEFTITATSNSGLALAFASSNTNVATVSDNKIKIVGVGTTTITASQSGNTEYLAASEVARTLTVEKGTQTITFNALERKIVPGDVVELESSSSAGLTITYTSSDTDVITVSGNKITGVAGGTATITATQAGNSLYAAATAVSHEVGVLMAQTITLTKIGDHTIGDAAFKLKATSTSGLPVTFSSNTVKLLIQGENHDEVLVQEAGTVTIVAHQEGNDEFAPAPDVSETICIKPAKPTITVSDNGNGEPLLTSSSGSANQWFKDEKAISGATLPFLTVDKNGSYTVQVKLNDCANISDAEEIVITSIEDQDKTVKIYPNPVTDQFIVDVSALTLKRNAQVNITDLSGRQLNSWEGKGKITCNIGGFSQGTYIVNIRVGKQKISRQLSKK
jgi:hypothetical protein